MKQQHGSGFISVEGVEGVGKTTNLAVIEAFFKRRGIPVVLTREPGGTLLGEQIREILLSTEGETIRADTELLLMFAARAQHIEHLMKPALEAGKWVVCDRFIDSTYAYQGAGRGMDTTRIQQLESLVLNGFQPDLTILLDLPVAIGLERAAARSHKDRFETEQIAFFERVRQCFLQRANADPERFRVIDTSLSPEEVEQEINVQLEVYFATYCY